MMEDAARRAQKDKKAKKKKNISSSSDSDASSDGSEELAKAVRKRSKTKDLSHLEKQLAQEQADEASLLRRIAEQQAKNEQKLQELAAARNNYPVCHVSPQIQLAFDLFVLADGYRKACNAIAACGDIDVRPVRKAAEKCDCGFHQRHPCPMANC